MSLSRSSSRSGERHFTINNAYHVDGCPTKFFHKDYTGHYKGHTAKQAAEKALSQLCRLKGIRGQCTLFIEMRETTQGSNHKLYSYHVKRYKLKEPIVLKDRVYYYTRKAKHVRIPTEKCPKSHKSSGRMRSRKHSSSSSSRSRSMSRVSKPRSKKSMTNTLMSKLF